MTFALDAHRIAQQIAVCNCSRACAALLKIQCTRASTFRVQPALALLPPASRVLVNVQLSPQPRKQERTPSECKFLVVVRELKSEGGVSGAAFELGRADHDGVGGPSERELKTRWKDAERRADRSLLFSEVLDVRVVAAQAVKTEHIRSKASTTTVSRSTGSSSSTAAAAFKPAFSTQQHARIVVLLMKNQSAAPANTLARDEAALLRRLRDACAPEQWDAWQVFARRMRVLLREQSRRAAAQEHCML
ncbi:hypothetical protein PybrP1_006595 [[Pythium] brassicae (nom. inval.)]|nr:hypothetical protein PybrP1_006595 [[Pythium] brassicae (nom. inval.)]